jgi:hypothetical protein
MPRRCVGRRLRVGILICKFQISNQTVLYFFLYSDDSPNVNDHSFDHLRIPLKDISQKNGYYYNLLHENEEQSINLALNPSQNREDDATPIVACTRNLPNTWDGHSVAARKRMADPNDPLEGTSTAFTPKRSKTSRSLNYFSYSI